MKLVESRSFPLGDTQLRLGQEMMMWRLGDVDAVTRNQRRWYSFDGTVIVLTLSHSSLI